jgi:hypothetical protein
MKKVFVILFLLLYIIFLIKAHVGFVMRRCREHKKSILKRFHRTLEAFHSHASYLNQDARQRLTINCQSSLAPQFLCPLLYGLCPSGWVPRRGLSVGPWVVLSNRECLTSCIFWSLPPPSSSFLKEIHLSMTF